MKRYRKIKRYNDPWKYVGHERFLRGLRKAEEDWHKHKSLEWYEKAYEEHSARLKARHPLKIKVK